MRRECIDCHEKEDKHKGMLAPTAPCHNARDWKIWDFDHANRPSSRSIRIARPPAFRHKLPWRAP
jgi:hypothetical protein